ncbi:histidinol-phosphatase [Anaerosinus gibii]|uniref:Histidinol-phosphatase n=1 Tax=Selenobaculum gibii TaxID=3054208 RepID=A0A9Y2AJA4_9FIRM|nr:histidinol-phosphatase [Selenobaculum gbiensis]WIW70455.1 histidinol-phosphatase [Selenobaculum gbiensis]
MKFDYHMHFEYGSYDLDWVRGFFDSAKTRGIDEIGISEHSHGFIEFKELYYDELILDDSIVGQYQQKWLKKNKFKYSLDDYFSFMNSLKEKGYPVKTGIEICNFKNQAKIKEIINNYDFDYIIGSVHFLKGWGYDFSDIKQVWQEHSLADIYHWYAQEIENLCESGLYDVLGHPFNIRLFKNLPDFSVDSVLVRVAKALKKANMAIDINTGTLYRYPIAEISPYPDFLKIAREYDLPIITSSDAHQPEDCGRYIDKAVEYAKEYGYEGSLTFTHRRAEFKKF